MPERARRLSIHYAWVVAGVTFLVLIGTHLIAACHDRGIPEIRSAQLLAMIGIFDIVGTTGAIRTVAGDYQLGFTAAGLLCVLAGSAFLLVGRRAFVPAAVPGMVVIAGT